MLKNRFYSHIKKRKCLNSLLEELKEAEINPVDIPKEIPQIAKVTIVPPITTFEPVLELVKDIEPETETEKTELSDNLSETINLQNFDVFTIFNDQNDNCTHREMVVPEVEVVILELNGFPYEDELHSRITGDNINYASEKSLLKTDYYTQIFSLIR